MTEVFDIADDYVRPSSARSIRAVRRTRASPGHDHEMTDYSPAGVAPRVDLVRETLAALDAATPDDRRRPARGRAS